MRVPNRSFDRCVFEGLLEYTVNCGARVLSACLFRRSGSKVCERIYVAECRLSAAAKIRFGLVLTLVYVRNLFMHGRSIVVWSVLAISKLMRIENV